MNQKELEQNQIQKRSKIQPKPKLEKSKKNRSEQLKRKIKTKSGKKKCKNKSTTKSKKKQNQSKKNKPCFHFFGFSCRFFLLFSTSYIFEGPGHQVTWERQTHEKTSEKKTKERAEKKQPNINVFSGLLFFGCWCVFKIVVWFFCLFPGFGHGEWLPFTSTGLEQPCQQCPVLSLCQWLLKRLPLGLQNGNNKVAGLCMSISSSK